MTPENISQEQDQTIMPLHIDYFCPFCGMKLFRGRVTTLKMVCAGCNKLVLIKDIENKHGSLDKGSNDY